VYIPNEDLDTYRFQQPLMLTGQVVWASEDDGVCVSGIKFDGLNAEQKRQLEICFNYFDRSPEYARSA
jgi:hypothetical protein